MTLTALTCLLRPVHVLWEIDATDIRRIEDGFYQSTITTWSGERRTVRETAWQVRQMMKGRI